jgi:hypothetical protein
MDNDAVRKVDPDNLRRREAELVQRIEKLKLSMNQTGDIGTLVHKNKLMKEAQEELRRLQERLAGTPES